MIKGRILVVCKDNQPPLGRVCGKEEQRKKRKKIYMIIQLSLLSLTHLLLSKLYGLVLFLLLEVEFCLCGYFLWGLLKEDYFLAFGEVTQSQKNTHGGY